MRGPTVTVIQPYVIAYAAGGLRTLSGVGSFVVPDVLVLAAGGILGEAWMSGLLGGIEDAADVDFRDVEAFVGTSAGSIVATRTSAKGARITSP